LIFVCGIIDSIVVFMNDKKLPSSICPVCTAIDTFIHIGVTGACTACKSQFELKFTVESETLEEFREKCIPNEAEESGIVEDMIKDLKKVSKKAKKTTKKSKKK
jgi:hypothetical protein